MWRCPECETFNEGENCAVCGFDMAAQDKAPFAPVGSFGTAPIPPVDRYTPMHIPPVGSYAPKTAPKPSVGMYAPMIKPKKKFNKFCVAGFVMSLLSVGFVAAAAVIEIFWF